MTVACFEGCDRGGARPPWSSLLLTVLLAALYAVLGPAPATLVYDAGAIADGEIWRLVTGHLVHADPVHLGANGLALLVLGGFFESLLRLSARLFWATVASAMAAIDVALWQWLPAIDWYCGFSGVLNAIFIVAVYACWRRSGDSVVRLLAMGGLLKIAIEDLGQEPLFAFGSLPSVIEAHFAGFWAGLAVCVGGLILSSTRGGSWLDWAHGTVSRFAPSRSRDRRAERRPDRHRHAERIRLSEPV
ncbi:MAG: rhombosortase [Pseudomonadota bacterium]